MFLISGALFGAAVGLAVSQMWLEAIFLAVLCVIALQWAIYARQAEWRRGGK